MQSDPLIGQQLGAYRILSKLGEGGMARVYKGYHARLRRDVAIKIILSQIADQEGFKARFEREAQSGSHGKRTHSPSELHHAPPSVGQGNAVALFVCAVEN